MMSLHKRSCDFVLLEKFPTSRLVASNAPLPADGQPFVVVCNSLANPSLEGKSAFLLWTAI